MKRYIHCEETSINREIAFLLFDIVVDLASSESELISAGKKSKQNKASDRLLHKPEVFLRDFGNFIEQCGFKLL